MSRLIDLIEPLIDTSSPEDFSHKKLDIDNHITDYFFYIKKISIILRITTRLSDLKANDNPINLIFCINKFLGEPYQLNGSCQQ